MSRYDPVYISDSDEEPMEASYDSDATVVAESPSIHVRATSDDSSDTFIAPPTLPTATPTPAHTVGETPRYTAETSRGPIPRMTARISVRDFPRGPLAPRDKAPMIELEGLPEEPPQRQQRFTHLDWMPRYLREWRALENVPSIFETGESSHSPPSHPITGEPVDQTIPTVVGVIRTIFRILSSRAAYIRELQSDVSRLDGDMVSTYERLDLAESFRFADRQIIEATRARVEVLERRARMTGLIAGVCVLVAVLWMTVGMYLPYFY